MRWNSRFHFGGISRLLLPDLHEEPLHSFPGRMRAHAAAPERGDSMEFNGDLMGFNGDLMGFNGALMEINCDLMDFLAKCVNTTPTTVLLMIYRTSCWGQQTYLVGQHLIRLKLWSSNMKMDNNPIAGDCPIKYADCSLPSAQIKTGCLDYSGVRVGGLLTTP